MDLILNGTIQPGKVFDLDLPLEKVAEVRGTEGL